MKKAIILLLALTFSMFASGATIYTLDGDDVAKSSFWTSQNLSALSTALNASSQVIDYQRVGIPSMTGQGGRFLTTDGTTFVWLDLDANYQPYSNILTATTASFTTALLTKLNGIADGATAFDGAYSSLTGLPTLGSLAALSAVTTTEITNGTVVNADISATAAIDLSKLATDPLARANHTGTQPYTTITGLGTLATQSGTFSGTSSGTNTGDQDLSGYALLSGTLAQFAPTTSSQLLGVISDESGTGSILTTNGSAANLTSFPTLNQSTTGNAATATALQTARTINGVSFDGTINITVDAAAGTLTGTTLAAGVTASSLLSAAGGTFGTAAFTNATAYEVPLTFSTGLTRTTNTITVNSSQSITTLSNLTSNGFVKTSGGTGALSIDTTSYQPLSSTLTTLSSATAAGLALMDDVDAAAQRATLGLGTLATQSGTFSGTSSGTNTGDQTITLTGDVSGSGTGSFAVTINSSFATDSEVGSAISALSSVYQPLDAALTALAAGSDFVQFTGPTTATKVFTLPDASAAILTDNAAVTVAQGGTGRTTSTTAYGLIAAGTTATGAQQTLAAGATTEILVGGGASALPVWTTATGSGAPVRAVSPSLTTPDIGVASATSINKVALTAPLTGSTLTIADGKTLTASNTITLTATDGSTLAIGTGGTLGTAAFTDTTAYEVPLTFSTGLTRTTNTITVNTSQNISTLSNLTSNGFVKTSGGTGALSVDTTTYLSGSLGATSNVVPMTSGTGGSTLQPSTMTIDGSGNVLVSGTASFSAPMLQIGDAATGIASIGADRLDIVTNGVQLMSLSKYAWISTPGATGIATPSISFDTGTPTNGPNIDDLTASPEGSSTGNPGAIRLVNDSGAGQLWVKASGTGNTGWVPASTITVDSTPIVGGSSDKLLLSGSAVGEASKASWSDTNTQLVIGDAGSSSSYGLVYIYDLTHSFKPAIKIDKSTWGSALDLAIATPSPVITATGGSSLATWSVSTTDTALSNAHNRGVSIDLRVDYDAYSSTGGYFSGSNLRTAAGSNPDLSFGLDAVASSGIADSGTWGAAIRATSGSANVYGLQTVMHASQVSEPLIIQTSAAATLASVNKDGQLFLANSSAPSTPSGGGMFYVSSGAPKFKGTSGVEVDLTGGGGGSVVFLGEFTATAASTLPCDNIFDAATYDHYIISGYLQPATDNVNMVMDLRTAVPANVGATWYAGGLYTRIDGGGTPQGALSSSTVLGSGIGNGANEGVFFDAGQLKIYSGYRHSLTVKMRVIQYTGTRYAQSYVVEFQDTTARQGIVFFFSSGNIATGLIRIWGVKKS